MKHDDDIIDNSHSVPLSVLMSVYIRESPKSLSECFDSLLCQTVQAEEWVLVEDGPLTDELHEVVSLYSSKYPGLIKLVPLEKNVGLGEAFRIGVSECSNDLIARMDTDDISVPNRFEIQWRMFKDNPELDICGSHVREFEGNIDNVVCARKVPITDAEIKRYQKRRDAFNHPTVMYKKEAVLRAGNYRNAPLMEDSVLWASMIASGVTCANYDGYLVYMRVDEGMYERRGGLEYFKRYRDARKSIYDAGYISFSDYWITIFAQFAIALAPKGVRRKMFGRALRDVS